MTPLALALELGEGRVGGALVPALPAAPIMPALFLVSSALLLLVSRALLLLVSPALRLLVSSALLLLGSPTLLL